MVHLWQFLFTIVKFCISWTYYCETLSWAKFTIVTALATTNEVTSAM